MSMRPNGRVDARKKVGYKVSFDKDEARRKREGNIVEIRKNKREEGLLKRRRQERPNLEPIQHKDSVSLPFLATAVMSGDVTAQLRATTHIRKLLCIPDNPPTDEVLKTGVVPYFVDFLRRADIPQLQIEAVWALTNIAAGTSEHTSVLIEHGAVPLLVQLLCSADEDLREQATWALGNIAGDSVKCRDLLLSHGALTNLLTLFNEDANLSTLKIATWTLSNLFRGTRRPPFELAKPALSILARLIQVEDDETLADACWALSFISDGDDDDIQNVIEAGVCQRLVELLLHPSTSIALASLKTIGNIASGNNIQTQYVINNGALPHLLPLITNHYKQVIITEACWTISNILAGTENQIQGVIDANIFPPLVSLLTNGAYLIKGEAAWAICNATSRGSNDQIKYLVSQGCIKPLCDLLACPDNRLIAVCLEALENILRVGNDGDYNKNNKYATSLMDAGGLVKIESLQEDKYNVLYEKALSIHKKYLADDQEKDG